ncbi:uncharacterized protein F5147DRAFT_233970 [Suillus discolor]|uniref:Uncharacterized protein n=1 Tax=Suillus discolor TaxID=1912936 RepID=A0A9P7JSW5_9AGAM|nr:uncharacterized protein F5147DRAFT_233970 [Suillus discolor]KAG2106226.1 hypothetical protein F5147DRAFT_233970 [Suillus discolor]
MLLTRLFAEIFLSRGLVKTNCCMYSMRSWIYGFGQEPCGPYCQSPSKFSDSQPAVDVGLSPSALIADVVKRSPVAHTFYFYSVLCEIASIPRKTPSA